MQKIATVFALGLMLIAPPTLAQIPGKLTPEQKAYLERMAVLDKELHPQFGDVRIAPAGVTLHLGKAYYYLPPAEAKRVLVEAWGNPPDSADGIDGIVFPAGESPVTADWGAVVDFEASGFVTDKDADKADYAKMISDVQAGEAERNANRQKEGFATQHLVGWAQAPSYDKARHALLWAREIAFADMEEHTLNYDTRILGRHGVLSLNMVSTMSLLPQVREASQAFAATADYDPGARYVDYDPKTDKKAEYGVAGLVAAGLGLAAAKKLGMLAIILAFGKKAIVFIVAFGASAVAWFKRRLGGGKAKAAETANETPSEEA